MKKFEKSIKNVKNPGRDRLKCRKTTKIDEKPCKKFKNVGKPSEMS